MTSDFLIRHIRNLSDETGRIETRCLCLIFPNLPKAPVAGQLWLLIGGFLIRKILSDMFLTFGKLETDGGPSSMNPMLLKKLQKTIHSVDRRDCPIAKDCTKCKMKECIIKDQYQYMVNGNGNRMNPLNGEIEMEWCFICHKLCVPSNYIILENSSDSGKLPRKQFFHYHCYKQLTKPNKKGTK